MSSKAEYLMEYGYVDLISDIVHTLPQFSHIRPRMVVCVRVLGWSPRQVDKKVTFARVRYVPPSVRRALDSEIRYVIEFYEAFYTQDMEDKAWTLVHELKHVRKNLSGVVKHSGFGDEESLGLYHQYKQLKQEKVVAQ